MLFCPTYKAGRGQAKQACSQVDVPRVTTRLSRDMQHQLASANQAGQKKNFIRSNIASTHTVPYKIVAHQGRLRILLHVLMMMI